MNRKITVFLVLLCLVACHSSSRQTVRLPYLNMLLPLEERVEDLVNRMTLEEKVAQMQYDAPAIERLGVPAYHWWSECLHGVGQAGMATVFPQAIGMAAAWNQPLMYEVATAISDEARAKHNHFVKEGKRGMYEGLTFSAPHIEIFRDPRWGRGQETYGEDPYLTSRLAVSFIRGLQGEDKRYLKVVATAKHFALPRRPSTGGQTESRQVSKQDMYETYLPAFKAAVEEAGVQAVMLPRQHQESPPNSQPSLEHLLRDTWHFKGYVVADCTTMHDIPGPATQDARQAAALAISDGTDLNCSHVSAHLKEAVEQQLITEDSLNEALSHLLTARFRLGMFDDPDSVVWNRIPYETVRSKKHQQLALQASRESIVLLKNEKKTLPLSKDVASIAVIGPNADAGQPMLGTHHGTSPHVITLLEGIRQKIGSQTEVLYAPGSRYAEGVPNLSVVPASVLSSGDQPGLQGAYFNDLSLKGTAVLTRQDSLIDFTWATQPPVADTFAVRWTGYLEPRMTGRHYIGVSADHGVKLSLEDSLYMDVEPGQHLLEKSFTIDLEKGKRYRISLEYYYAGPDPQVHLLWSEPGPPLLEQALAAARKAEVVVLCLGLTPQLESEPMPLKVPGFADGRRTDIALPPPQETLVREVYKLGKPVVLVLMSGGAVAFPWVNSHLPAVLQAWYPGEFGGAAIADVLFGDYNPSGRLPVTFYQSVGDLPAFENYSMENLTYKFFKGEPLYPFGYGLSYTRFAYQNLQLPDTARISDTVQVSVEVKNTGDRAGDEVVQLYVSDREASVRTPVRALQGFRKVHLQPGETQTVRFTLLPHQYAAITEGGNFLLEPGMIHLSVGGAQPGFGRRLTPETTEILHGSFFSEGENIHL